jgi:hypothetical protein
MDKAITIRVAAPLAGDLVTARLAEPIASDRRSGVLDLVVEASFLVKDVSSVVLAVAGGIQGMRAIIDWLQGRDLEDEVELTIDLPDGPRSWTLRAQTLDEVTSAEIARVLEALASQRAQGSIQQARRGETVPLSEP